LVPMMYPKKSDINSLGDNQEHRKKRLELITLSIGGKKRVAGSRRVYFRQRIRKEVGRLSKEEKARRPGSPKGSLQWQKGPRADWGMARVP